MNKLLIPILLMFWGCGSHIKVNPAGCPGTVYYTETPKRDRAYSKLYEKPNFETMKKRRDFFVEETVWTPFGFMKATEVNIKLLLANYDVDCADVENLRVTLTSNFKDMIFSFIPFLSQKSIVVSGMFKEFTKFNVKEDKGPVEE